jgi:hypothetical protein
VRPVALRNGVGIEDPLSVVLDLLRTYRRLGISDLAQPAAFGEPDLRLANRGGARISAAEIAAILERRGAIEGALRAIAPDVSLAGAADSVPWLVLRQLFDAFADIRGVGFAKMTKALHPKRPALIPMLDSIVQGYLRDDDLGAHAPFGERALGLVHGYKRDLDRNWAALQAVREDLARSGYALTEVRILDLLILSASAETAARPAGGLPAGGLGRPPARATRHRQGRRPLVPASRPDADRNTTARSDKLKFFFAERILVPLPQHHEERRRRHQLARGAGPPGTPSLSWPSPALSCELPRRRADERACLFYRLLRFNWLISRDV